MHEVIRCSAVAVGLLLLVGTTVAEAQHRGRAATRASEGAFMIGGSQLDMGELNARLAAFGYPSFDDTFLQVGYVRQFRSRGPVRLGLELAGLGRPSAVTADNRFRTRVTGGYGLLNVGYDVHHDGRFSVQPKAGVGFGAVRLHVDDREAPGFDEILAQPGRSVNLSTGSMLLDGTVALRYRLGTGRRSLMLGARAGYTHSLLHGEWRREETDAPGGPTAGWGGPHFEFMIGRSVRR